LLARAASVYSLSSLRAPRQSWARASLCWAATMAAATGFALALRIDILPAWDWLALWLLAGFLCLALTRALAAAVTGALTRSGRLDRYVVIVGGGPLAAGLLDALLRTPSPDLRILGLFDDRDDERSPDVVAGYPKLGTIDDLVAFARHVRVDQIVFALPINAEKRIIDLLDKLWVLPADFRLAAHANRLRFHPRAYSFIGGAPAFDLMDKPLSDAAVAAKAIFDRIVGLALTILLAPLMSAVAVGVKLSSPGPALFRQERFGFNNERITVYKFRSLFADQCDDEASRLVRRDDPRVTPFGRFIRRTSLDELPQLFNVLKGDLSLVGPRPHALGAKAADREYEKVVDGYFARHRFKPGVTGWAQVNGWRGETDTFEKIERRVECDLEYIENWSLLLDLYILALTPIALARSPNAY
jgi:Undecaprenyl-phosphate glucose phosphotransferase